MSSPARLAANIANAQLSTGPRTEEGKAASSKNALKSGLFSAGDFIRPGEESFYTELDESLHAELAPSGILEHNLVSEIRRATWRLRRCGQIEASFIDSAPTDAPIPDPMQNEATAKLQLSVDRARSQAHRLLHKCTAELRKLQTERQIRTQFLKTRAAARPAQNEPNRTENPLRAATISMVPPTAAPDEKPVAIQNQTPRNARCACGSGQKYKRCCGRNAPPVLYAAA